MYRAAYGKTFATTGRIGQLMLRNFALIDALDCSAHGKTFTLLGALCCS